MRRTTSIRLLAIALAGASLMLVGYGPVNDCDIEVNYNPDTGEVNCEFEGIISDEPPPTGEKIKKPVVFVAPFRYLWSDGSCYWWSPNDGGLDTWDLANEPAMYAIILNTPKCVSEPLPDRAWRVFHSFPLSKPDPELNPTTAGITGYPTYLAAVNPASIDHFEILPSTEPFEVRAWVGALQVDWGDGWVLSHEPTVALPYPDGAVTHIYTTKTCPPDYRIMHPSGRNCHPTLEAYPVTATYTWWGEYRIGGGSWIPIGTLDLATTVLYDVDEVFGVLVDP